MSPRITGAQKPRRVAAQKMQALQARKQCLPFKANKVAGSRAEWAAGQNPKLKRSYAKHSESVARMRARNHGNPPIDCFMHKRKRR